MSLTLPTKVKSAEAFWNFYNQNKDEVERIIWDACWRHQNAVDPHDMHQDLIVRLHRSNFLRRFDPKQAQLGTYFTGRVNGYARHIVSKTLKQERYYDQALCIEFNKTDEEHNASPELALEPDIEESLFNEEVFQHACDLLTNVQKTFFKMYLEGHDAGEIAKAFSITTHNFMHQWQEIKEILREATIASADGEGQIKALFSHWNRNEPESRIVRKKVSIGNGNGHAKEKRRPLSDREKEILRTMFLEVNGQIESKVCVEMKKKVGPDISMAQVTGQMVGFHMQVAKSKMAVKDHKAYQQCIQTHRAKWATYKSAKYQDPKFQKKAGSAIGSKGRTKLTTVFRSKTTKKALQA
jgi:RNA polymerase sigma factor (sigma-70 family)